jgi:hypothetical protein
MPPALLSFTCVRIEVAMVTVMVCATHCRRPLLEPPLAVACCYGWW